MDMDKMHDAYLECAVWSSTDDEGNPLDNEYSVDDFTNRARKESERECWDFRDYCIKQGIDFDSLDSEQTGHDFWLTRNGHGAGFWDRGLGELGTKLTDAAHTFGSSDIYVGRTGKLNFA